MSSSDSLDYFPDNKGTHFRVKLSESLILKGTWEAVLTSLTIIANETDIKDVLAGQVVEVTSNLVGLCIIGGDKRQVLRRVNLGSPVVSAGSRSVFHIDSLENCCFYMPVITQECSIIELGLKHQSLYINDILEDSRVYASVYLKRVQ